MMKVTIDMLGQRYGRYTVMERAGSSPGGAAKWLCRCDCGIEKVVFGNDLRRGQVLSCGCLKRERTSQTHWKHGASTTPTYLSWNSMRQRCNGNGTNSMRYYVHLDVCERWSEYTNFLADMGERPEGKTLDRIDNAKGYSPENCRWATVHEQAANTRQVCYICDGDELIPLVTFAKKVGLSPNAMKRRFHAICGGKGPVDAELLTGERPFGYWQKLTRARLLADAASQPAGS